MKIHSETRKLVLNDCPCGIDIALASRERFLTTSSPLRRRILTTKCSAVPTTNIVHGKEHCLRNIRLVANRRNMGEKCLDLSRSGFSSDSPSFLNRVLVSARRTFCHSRKIQRSKTQRNKAGKDSTGNEVKNTLSTPGLLSKPFGCEAYGLGDCLLKTGTGPWSNCPY